jgi:cell division protein FtsQ
MWDSPRLLNMAAGALVGIALLLFSVAAAVLVLRSERFPVREVDVTTAPKKTTRAEIEAALQGRVAGNFFAVSPDEVRAALEKLPWVRRASVRRIWPDTFEVELEEHVAFARWGSDALVNTYGEKFFGRSADALPLFIGPEGTEGEVTRRYARFSQIAAALGSPLERVVLTARFAWQLRLGNGLNIMLGRDADAAEGRLKRFVDVYDFTLKNIDRKREYVDLRYPNGFALRVADLKGI